jgi:hypothetical protein
MRPNRRSFLGTVLGGTVSAAVTGRAASAEDRRDLLRRIDQVTAAPVLRVEELDKPV